MAARPGPDLAVVELRPDILHKIYHLAAVLINKSNLHVG